MLRTTFEGSQTHIDSKRSKMTYSTRDSKDHFIPYDLKLSNMLTTVEPRCRTEVLDRCKMEAIRKIPRVFDFMSEPYVLNPRNNQSIADVSSVFCILLLFLP
ncbi:hypothetical protein TNCV_3342751 [Trichonephila clavipes]|nr:hypothetical protein TNCV_3342751 [Trichonephila clavipes]